MTKQPVAETVRARRTVYDFEQGSLSRELIANLLEAAVCAPNHRRTRPWRFVVVDGEAREGLARLRGDLARRRAEREGRGIERVPAQVAEFLRPAAYVYVVQKVAGDEHRQREDYASCAIAAYIVQIAAWEQGVGARWGTGLMASDPAVYETLGLADDERIVCYLGLGRPKELPPAQTRDAASVTRFVDQLG